MKIQLITAVSLANIVSQLNISTLSDNADKLSLLRLAVHLRKYPEQWEATCNTAKTMDPEAAQTLVNTEAKTEVEIPDTLLISKESAEQLALANADKLTAGALTYIIEYLPKP